MGRISDIHIGYQDMIAEGELDEMPNEIIPTKVEISGKEYELNPLPPMRSNIMRDSTSGYIGQLLFDLNTIKQELDFYKERFEWERARVYKAWKDNPEAKEKLAYTKRWRFETKRDKKIREIKTRLKGVK